MSLRQTLRTNHWPAVTVGSKDFAPSNVHYCNFFFFLEIETSERKWSYGDVSAISCWIRQRARETRTRVVFERNRLSVAAPESRVLGATALSQGLSDMLLHVPLLYTPYSMRALQDALLTMLLVDFWLLLRILTASLFCSVFRPLLVALTKNATQ
jgi:hypothetical protein